MSVARVVDTLSNAFPADRLALPGTEAHGKLNSSYLSQLESDITPAAIFLPKTKEDVAAFVKHIKPLVDHDGARFAIRGAGQQPLPGCANIQNGITLDLSRLTGIELRDDGIISIGAGERWGPVYDKLHEHGLGVTGSRSALGGIGGLALAGGLSFFSSREGFVCDNVVNYEVVLASGDIVNANAKHKTDLFTALRGGGNNLGVVTRFDMRTFQQGPFWGGSVIYFPTTFPSQIEALVEELNKPDATEETHIMISLFFAAQFGNVMGLNQVYYTKEVEKPAVLEPFTTMQPQVDQMNSMRMITLKDAATEQAAMAMAGIRCAYLNTTTKSDVITLKAAAEIFSTALEQVKGVEGVVCSFTLQPYPLSLLKLTASAGGNVLGLNVADGPFVSVLLLMYWKNKIDDDKMLETARGVITAIDKDAVERGQAVPYKYLNYAFGFQNPIASYGGKNKDNLQNTSKKYDPDGLFQKGVPGGFKLFA